MLNCSDKIHQGGGVAAPIGSQVLGEVLPYLEVEKDNLSEEDIVEEVEVPNIEGMTITEAKKELQKVGLEIDYEEAEGAEEKIVTNQVPINGVKINKGTKVIVEYD